ncbi:MAG: hypothetical protein J0I06_11250, partial [Planctomycetes bacterium]|nr:hypothetical protein [Planctomycetota bacterium]
RFPQIGQEIAPAPGLLVGFLTDVRHQHEVTEVSGGDRDAIAFWFQAADPAQRATPDASERKRAIALAVARCPDLGDRLPNQPCGGSLHRCNRFGDKTSRVGRCADENRTCAGCSHHPANAPARAPAPAPVPTIALNMGAGGLGDAIQGLLAVGAVKRENSAAHVRYRINPRWFGFAELFHGYDSLAPYEWDGGGVKVLGGPDRQLNADYLASERPGAPPRIERYMKNAGARGPAEPIRLKEPNRLKALGARWGGCVALCPFSAGSDREWSIPAWLTLEKQLRAAGYRTVVLHSEQKRTEPFVGEKLIGASPEEVVGCLLNCAAAIGLDSGLSHLAAAVGTPTVVLCGQTDGAKVFGCYPSARWLSGPLACSGCYWQGAVWSKERCRPQCPSIQGIQPSQVLAAVAEIARPTVRTVVFEQGAGGIGDGLLGLCAVAGYAAEDPATRIVYNVGAIARPFVELFTGADVVGVNAVEHTEAPVPGAVQVNAGYSGECRHGPQEAGPDFRSALAVRPRWERYAANVGATACRLPELREPERVRALGADHAGAIVLCPYSTDPARTWSLRHWLTLERRLIAAGYRTVVAHSGPEGLEQFAGAKLAGAPADRLAGVMLNAVCVVGNDSGPAHLAGVLGVPVVVVGGVTPVERLFGFYPKAVAVQGKLFCTGCAGGPPADAGCFKSCASLQSVDPDRVARAVVELAGERPAARAETPAPDHLTALRAAVATPPPYPGGSGRGGVTAGEGRYWPMTVAMIRSLRDTGCVLPVEVWYRGEAGAVRPSDVDGLGVTLIDADARARQFGDSRVPRGDPDKGGWENKLYALTHTRFETAVWIDADAIPLADPAVLADLADAHGLAMWTDRSDEALQHLRWNEVWPDAPAAARAFRVSAGQFAVHRRAAWAALATAHWICQYSDHYFARMLGDNDAWAVALAATGTPFRDLGELVKLPGVKHLYRFDLDGSTLFLHRSGPKLIPIAGHAAADARHVTHFARALLPRTGTRLARLAATVPFRAYTDADDAEQSRHLEEDDWLYQPGRRRYLCSILGAVEEELRGLRPDLARLVREAVMIGRRLSDFGTPQAELDWTSDRPPRGAA